MSRGVRPVGAALREPTTDAMVAAAQKALDVAESTEAWMIRVYQARVRGLQAHVVRHGLESAVDTGLVDQLATVAADWAVAHAGANYARGVLAGVVADCAVSA